MRDLRRKVTVGIVGGSDLTKISEQLGDGVEREYEYVFSENGLVAHERGRCWRSSRCGVFGRG